MAISNRRLCRGDYLEQMQKIAATDVKAVIVREKDLPESEYETLSGPLMELFGDRCILHTYVNAARRLGSRRIHLPLPLLRISDVSDMEAVGVSCHSVEDAREAVALGATYITAGHVFDTDCKKGLPGRGLSFLTDICRAVEIPVYAIGGITLENLPEILACGAAGGCMMSGFMRL